MRQLQNKITEWWFAERYQQLLWLPVLLSVGIGGYFSLKQEPALTPPLTVAVGLVLAWAVLRRYYLPRLVCFCLLMVVVGFLAAKGSTLRAEAPVIPAPTKIISVEGRVVDIKVTEKGSKLILDGLVLENIPPQDTPRRISVSLKFYDSNVQLGDRISLRAGLMPPSTPAMPGAFDFGRYFYFKQLGAIGFGLPPLTRLQPAEMSGFCLTFTEYQNRITERIRHAMREPEGAVAAALITGVTSAIPQEVFDTMRVSGLYHLLAVSGMNLALVAGILFFAARWFWVLIPGFALRFSTKKAAAIVALLGSYAYLLIAGSPVSAERAFYMVALLLLAVMLDRVVTPMRSLIWAAVVILLVAPESLVNAGFQLSFAATIALIAFFDWFTPILTRKRTDAHWFFRMLLYLFSGVCASLVAGLATLPFLIYHFNTMASYTLIANMLAIPLVSFWIMPCAVLGMVLMPFGLEVLGFVPMQWGITLMLQVASTAAQLPFASIRLPSLTEAGLSAFALGGVWIAFWQHRVRLLGIVPMLLGCMSISGQTFPDVLVSSDGKQQAVRVEDRLILIEGRKKDFIVKEWQDSLALEEVYPLKELTAEVAGLRCDGQGCIFRKAGRSVAFAKGQAVVAEDCGQVDALIDAAWESGCNSGVVIDRNFLKENGATVLYLEPHALRRTSVADTLGKRPWTRFISR